MSRVSSFPFFLSYIEDVATQIGQDELNVIDVKKKDPKMQSLQFPLQVILLLHLHQEDFEEVEIQVIEMEIGHVMRTLFFKPKSNRN
jgi:hypothetical protein